MRVRRRDRKRGQVFARCWSQDVLVTREDTERVTEETQGQFPVLPTKSESKWNEFFPYKSFFYLHRMCLCLRIHYLMYWCLQFIVCKINKNIRVLRSLLSSSHSEEHQGVYQKQTKGNILRENTGLSFSDHFPSVDTTTHSQYTCISQISLFLCVSHIHIKDSLPWPHILPQWIFRLDLVGQTSAQCQYAFSIILKQNEKTRRVIIFPCRLPDLKYNPETAGGQRKNQWLQVWVQMSITNMKDRIFTQQWLCLAWRE